MKHFLRVFSAALILFCISCAQKAQAQTYDVVFMGNSITELWLKYHASSFFTPNKYLGKGISGQTTVDMLGRFKNDVINNKPKVVVILAGTNDIAQNDGYIAVEQITENIMTMASRAKEAGSKVIICSILPANRYGWTTVVPEPAKVVRTVNTLLEQAARQNGYTWIDFYSPLVNTTNGTNTEFCSDNVHPLPTGYELIEQIIQPYLTDLLK